MPSESLSVAMGLLAAGTISFPLTLRLMMGQRYFLASSYWVLCVGLGVFAHLCLLVCVATVVGLALLAIARPAPTAEFANQRLSTWSMPAKAYLALTLLLLAAGTVWVILIVWSRPEG